MQSNQIPIYKKNDFQKMQKAGRLAAYILDQLYELIQQGISKLELIDFFPYKNVGSNFVMTAHVLFKKVDPNFVATQSNMILN